MKFMKIKPAKPGLRIRDPETKRPIPDEGKKVKWSSYWERRKLDGSIVFCSDLAVERPKKKKKKEVVTDKEEKIETIGD